MTNFKQLLFPAAGAAILLPAMMACSGNKERNNADVEFDFYRYDVIAEYADSVASPLEGGDYCKVTGRGVLPRVIGNNDISMLRDSLCRLGEVILLGSKDAQPLLNSELSITSLDTDSVNACSEQGNELSVDLITPRLIVWKDFSYSYPCGAAHGMYNTSYVNYSIVNGEILSLNDIFKKGSSPALADIIRNKLEGENINLLKPLNEIEVPADFRISTHSIEFIYSLYEIAPYSEGEIKVEIERYELDGLFADGIEDLLFGD